MTWCNNNKKKKLSTLTTGLRRILALDTNQRSETYFTLKSMLLIYLKYLVSIGRGLICGSSPCISKTKRNSIHTYVNFSFCFGISNEELSPETFVLRYESLSIHIGWGHLGMVRKPDTLIILSRTEMQEDVELLFLKLTIPFAVIATR